MIEVKDKRRRTKRKLDESIEKNGCPAVQPKETILDMSVSKLAKAKTRFNLEPSLRKTVMIVNTIRKIEQEIENGEGVNVNDSETAMSIDDCVVNEAKTKSSSLKVGTFGGATECRDVVPVRMSMTLERRSKPFGYNENNSEKFSNRYNCRSYGVSLAKSDRPDENLIDLTQSHQVKRKLMGKCSSTCHKTVPSYNEPSDLDGEINFSEIDISLYDFDATLSWSDGGIQFACGELDDNENVYKTNTGLSALFRRCSDDLKFNKTTDNSFTDELDQIMQVLVGI